MQKSFRVLVALAIVVAAIWAWKTFFPSPERVIRSRLVKLAKLNSFEPGEGNIAKAFAVQKLDDYFTPDVTVTIDVRGYDAFSFNGRQDLVSSVSRMRFYLQGMKVELPDIAVTLGPDKQTASADVTGKLTISGEHDFIVQELKFTLKKVDGKWLIDHVETVKTLGRSTTAALALALAQ